MPARYGLAQLYGLVVDNDFRAFSKIGQRYCDVIQRMDLDVLHINLKRP
jgi:hypothetical protein